MLSKMYLGKHQIRKSTVLVCPHHISDLWVCRLHQNPSVGGNVVHEFIKSGPLDFLALQVCHRVQEVKDHAALLKFLGEQFLLFSRGGIWKDTSYVNLLNDPVLTLLKNTTEH